MSKVKIDRQSDLNIGTAGHVDHGKCVSSDTKVYTPLYGDLGIGDLWGILENNGIKIHRLSRDEEIIKRFIDVYSYGNNGIVKSKALLYRQRYDGRMYKIITSTGMVVEVSPIHKLPVYSNEDTIKWLEADKLEAGIPLLVASDDNFSRVSIDEIDKIVVQRYSGYIYDLMVPSLHTFLGGSGPIILHNTTIIEGLTGIWTSSHSEELRRGITIRIGYADMPIFRLTGPSGEIYWSRPEFNGYGNPELVRVISFVDCPGHESLMANMLSGAAVMDGAMLVIAANEDVPRPQTKEHTMALQILGVKHLVVVQNKIDLVSKREAIENYEKIRDFLSTTIYADAPIIPVSAVHRINLHYLVEALYKYIPVPHRDLEKPFRMFIIRSFDINKPGESFEKLKGGVIGGSIVQGKVSVGDEIEVSPGYIYSEEGKIKYKPLYTEVKSIRTRYTSLKEAYGGGLIGIQTDLDPYLTKSDGLVGSVAGKPDTLPPVLYEFDMNVELFKYVVGTDETILVKELSRGDRLRLNVGPAVTLAIVTDVSREHVHVKLIRPVIAGSGWRVAIAAQVNNLWRLVGVGTVV